MPKKQTLEEFIKKSNIAHNFKYNYDKSIYINKQTKVIVTCPEHGDFEVTPGAHYILKSGCPECAKISRSKTKSKGLEKFIKQANLKWNSFYNYSKVNYINNYTKVEIICPIHGSFFKDPRTLKILEDNGIIFKYERWASGKMAQIKNVSEFGQYADFAFPPGIQTSDKIKNTIKGSQAYNIFYSPMVVAPWKPIVCILDSNGLIENKKEYQALKMDRFLQLDFKYS